jgi:cyclic pyranopterin phosphate synthase
MIKINFYLPHSLRVKLTTKCQLKCRFCHQEGYANTKDIDGDELIKILKILKKQLGFSRVHFTGGEPTFYNDFEKLLRETKGLGYINALTSNGQFTPDKLMRLKKAGLDSINFSLHTFDQYSFLKMQNVTFDIKTGLKWAQECIEKSIQNILSANKVLETKVNCVVSKESVSPKKVLDFCIQNDIQLRFLNDLTAGETAINKIKEILYEKKAELVSHNITLLSSSHVLIYKIGDYKFGVKCIRPFFLSSLCSNCKLKREGKCLEGFYGIRVEDKPMKVRLCLNKSEPPALQSLDEFLKSAQFKEIKNKVNSFLKCFQASQIVNI